MAAHNEFAKGFAGMCGKGAVPEPWGHTHLGQPVASQSFGDGTLWTFGLATATCTVDGGSFRFVGRPFAPDDRPIAHPQDAAALETLLSGLDGRFSLCCCLPNGDTVVATDWLGLGPLFVAELHGTVYFASHLGLLIDMLGDLPPIDHTGVASMLAGTTLMGGRTPYLGVRRLMAGQMATISTRNPVQLSIQPYVDPVEVLSRNRPNGADIEDQFDDLLQAAVRRERFDAATSLVMLSGGRDSRALAYVLAEQCHEPVRAATFGRLSSTEMRTAQRVAHALRFSHTAIPDDGWTLHGEAPFVAGLSGGSSGLQTALFTVPFRAVSDRATVAMTGFFGDAMTGAHLEGRAYEHLVMSRLPLWRAPLEETYADEFRVIRAEVQQIDRRLSDVAPHQRALFIDFTLRQATWISQSFSLCGWFVEFSAPFVHRDLVSFLFNLPAEHLERQALYDRWLNRKAQTLQRSQWLTAAATKRAAAFRSMAERAVYRGLGLGNPSAVVDWSKMHRASFEWFDEAVRGFTDDERLRGIAERELRALRQAARISAFSPLLFALGIMRARTDKRLAG